MKVSQQACCGWGVGVIYLLRPWGKKAEPEKTTASALSNPAHLPQCAMTWER